MRNNGGKEIIEGLFIRSITCVDKSLAILLDDLSGEPTHSANINEENFVTQIRILLSVEV
jgi:hypothetical protein